MISVLRRDLAAQICAHLEDNDEPCRFWAAWTATLFRLPNALEALYPYSLKADLPHWWEGLDKVVDLAAPAIDECLQAAPPEERERIPILLGIASPDPPCNRTKVPSARQ